MLVEICVLDFRSQTYATLLNCWKFLKFYRTKFRWFISKLNGFHESERFVKIDRNATMDNQQPSLNEIQPSLGRRSQTKMAVGNF